MQKRSENSFLHSAFLILNSKKLALFVGSGYFRELRYVFNQIFTYRTSHLHIEFLKNVRPDRASVSNAAGHSIGEHHGWRGKRAMSRSLPLNEPSTSVITMAQTLFRPALLL